MTRIPYLISTMCVLVLMLVSTAATGVGGFELRAERPSSDEAVLVVRTYGCNQPAHAKVNGTAEGLVNGKRQTLPLKLTATAEGVYAVEWKQPAQGDWLLTLTGTYRGHISSLLVNLDNEGRAVLPAPDAQGRHIQSIPRNLTNADVVRALKQPAYKG